MRIEYTFGDISASHSGRMDDTSRAYRRFVFTSSLKMIISGGCWKRTELGCMTSLCPVETVR